MTRAHNVNKRKKGNSDMKKRFSLLSLAASLVCLFLLLCGFPAPAAESEPEQSFSLSASPDSPYPGETVNVQLSPSFDVDRYGIRWEWEGGADNFVAKGDDSASYEAQDSPAKISAQIWDRLSGSDVNNLSLEVHPQSYAVAIRVLTPLGTVRLWDDDSKSMTDRQGRIARSKVVLDATVEPQPDGELRYVWKPGEGIVQNSEEENRCVVYRETPGTVVVSLSVFDRNNIRLGEADI